MNNQQEIKPAQVYSGDLVQATLLKGLLEDNGIPAFLENELMSTIAPWRLGSDAHNPVKLVVSSLDYDAAIKLIEEFNTAEPLDEE